jgi:hypothetical protein
MGTRRETAAPALSLVKLTNHHEQLEGRGLDARSQLRDGIAKGFGLRLALEPG